MSLSGANLHESPRVSCLNGERHIETHRDSLRLFAEYLPLIDPNFYADNTEGRVRIDDRKVDVRAQRVQRQAAPRNPLAARDLRSADAAREPNFRPFDFLVRH